MGKMTSLVERGPLKLKENSSEETMKKVAEVIHKRRLVQNEDALGFIFVQVTMCARNFVVLVDTGATNIFLRKKTTKYLKLKVEMERELSAFNSINSSMKVVKSSKRYTGEGWLML